MSNQGDADCSATEIQVTVDTAQPTNQPHSQLCALSALHLISEPIHITAQKHKIAAEGFYHQMAKRLH